jgi:hypothetical protein
MIDTSPDSIRVFFIITLSIWWLYLLNQHLRKNESDN